MLDIFYFSSLNTRVRHFPGVDKLTTVDCWILKDSSGGKAKWVLSFFAVSFLSVEYFRSVAKPPINLL